MKKETLDRVIVDLPIIYFSAVVSATSQYMLSLNKEQHTSYLVIGKILIITLIAAGIIFGIYYIVYKITNRFSKISGKINRKIKSSVR